MLINELTDKRTKTIKGRNEFIYNEMMKNASESIEAFKSENIIYKGMFIPNNKDIYITDPKLKKRKSVGTTSNHYTQLLSNLPSWEDYPKRDSSLICTTQSSIARDFGRIFIVLPFDSATIAVCPGHDIWTAQTEIPETSLLFFNDILKECNISDTSYKNLIASILKNKNKIYNCKFLDKDSEFAYELSMCRTYNGVINLLDNFLSPNKMGFYTSSIMNIPRDENHEVWTDSKSYLVRIDSDFYNYLLDI